LSDEGEQLSELLALIEPRYEPRNTECEVSVFRFLQAKR